MATGQNRRQLSWQKHKDILWGVNGCLSSPATTTKRKRKTYWSQRGSNLPFSLCVTYAVINMLVSTQQHSATHTINDELCVGVQLGAVLRNRGLVCTQAFKADANVWSVRGLGLLLQCWTSSKNENSLENADESTVPNGHCSDFWNGVKRRVRVEMDMRLLRCANIQLQRTCALLRCALHSTPPGPWCTQTWVGRKFTFLWTFFTDEWV